MVKKIILLVKYVTIDGEHEYSCHTTMILSSRQKIEKHIHKYFIDFWGRDSEGHYNADKEDCKPCEFYSYFAGSVAIKRLSWREITPEQNDVLLDLSL